MRKWLKESLLKEIKTEQDFEEWKKEWFEKIPKCKDFVCIHDSMLCGIKIMCGDCSIFRTFRRGEWENICEFVSCNDCRKKFECEKLRNRKTDRSEVFEDVKEKKTEVYS